MDPITIGAIIALGLTAVGSYIYRKCRAEQRKTAEIEVLSQALERYASQVALEEVDRPIVDAVRCTLARLCSPSVEEKVKDMDLAARRHFFAVIVRDVSRAMDVDIKSLSFGDLGYGHLGCCRNEGFDIHLEIADALIMADPRRAVATICHELRHAQQFTSFIDDKWGFSERRKAQWMSEYAATVSEHATESEAMFFAYRCQMLELDANNFASAATKNIA